MFNLYPIVNINKNGSPDMGLIELCLKNNVDFLQIRMKNSEEESIVRVTEDIIKKRNELCVSTKIIVNDNVDAAVKAGADGVHVGQDDTDPDEIKKKYPDLIVGLSTHDLYQVDAANDRNIDYIGFGPVFRTNTKETADRTVLEHVYEAAERSVYPVVFIGGITEDNIDMIPGGRKIYAASISGLRKLMGVRYA